MNKLLILPVLVLGAVSLSFSVSAAARHTYHPVRYVVGTSTHVVKWAGDSTVAVAKGTGQFIGGVFKAGVNLTTGAYNSVVH